MELPVRKKLPHAIPPWVADGSWFFITVNCVPPGKNQLCRADIGDAVLATFQHNHANLTWHCRMALLMPDHWHGIMAFPQAPGMKTVIKTGSGLWRVTMAWSGNATSSIIACATIMN